MNPGELKHRINILALSRVDRVYTWEVIDTVWAKYEDLNKTNLFSKVGIGVKSAKFTIRKRNLTLFEAIRWQGKHYFITDIVEIDRMYLEVTAAQIEPRVCIAKRITSVKDQYNRPIPSEPEIIATFPACLVEKYLGYQQQKPQAMNEITYVLVTPKIIQLEVGDLVEIGEDTYNVQIVHELDEYKNEYEITINKEA